MLDYSKLGSSPREFMLGQLLELAEKVRAEPGRQSIGFMVLWMSFNAWGSILTEEDRDAEMLERLAADQRIADTFRDRLTSDADFATAVHKFTEYWPIFCNGDIGLMGLWPDVQALYPAGRAATARELKKHANQSARRKPDGSLRPGVRRRPSNDNFDAVNPSWPDTLEALYQVRNNLMHGTKGFDGDDTQIIEGAYETLDKFVRGSDLYVWR